MTVEDIEKIAAKLNFGVPAVVGILILLFCITNVDKLLLILAKIQEIFSFVSVKARKGAIANSIRGKAMKASKAYRSFGSDMIASDLKIDWVQRESPEAFLKNNQVIVRMKQSANPHQNYVTAVTAFVNQGLLPKAKQYIDAEIYNVSKLSISRSLILNGDAEALDFFDENILSPILDADDSARDIFDRLKTIDKNGMFINILLNEYAKAGRKIYPELPDPLFAVESRELLTYLYHIALGNLDDADAFQFNREYFRLHIILAAKSTTYSKAGINPYLKHINASLSEGIETIYVFGLGRKMEIAKEIVKTISTTDFRIVSTTPHLYRHRSIFDGRSVSGVCYEMSVYKEN